MRDFQGQDLVRYVELVLNFMAVTQPPCKETFIFVEIQEVNLYAASYILVTQKQRGVNTYLMI